MLFIPFSQNISNTSITNVKKIEMYNQLVTTLPQTTAYYQIKDISCPATQFLLPSPFKQQLYYFFHKVDTHTFIAHSLSAAHICSKYGPVICFFYIISVKWVIILLLPIHIFLYMTGCKHRYLIFILCNYIFTNCNRSTLLFLSFCFSLCDLFLY